MSPWTMTAVAIWPLWPLRVSREENTQTATLIFFFFEFFLQPYQHSQQEIKIRKNWNQTEPEKRYRHCRNTRGKMQLYIY